jgi:hypothetical protein
VLAPSCLTLTLVSDSQLFSTHCVRFTVRTKSHFSPSGSGIVHAPRICSTDEATSLSVMILTEYVNLPLS